MEGKHLHEIHVVEEYNGWQIVATRRRFKGRGMFTPWEPTTSASVKDVQDMRDRKLGFTAVKIMRDKDTKTTTEMLLWMPRRNFDDN